MFCNKCGKFIKDDTDFCPECGNKIIRDNVDGNEMTFCNQCGKKVEKDTVFCPGCGNKIVKDTVNTNVTQNNTSNINTNVAQTNISNINTNVNQNNVAPVQNYQQPVQTQYQQPVQYQQPIGQYQQRPQQYTYTNPNTYMRKKSGGGAGTIVLLIIIGLAGYFFFSNGGVDILVDTPEIDNGYENGGGGSSSGGGTTGRRNSGETAIEIDHVYQNVTINSPSTVYSYIKKDSEDQKSACPSEIQSIEKKIMDEFDITAVNLCEIDINFARGIYDSLKWVYNYFPSIRGKLTNISIGNISNTGAIAYFQPIFPFLYEGSKDNPNKIGIKMSVVLSSEYYLNEDRLTEAVTNSSKAGHFPPNASKYSPMVHEFGHYTSFIALMKNKGTSSTLIWDVSNDQLMSSIVDDFNVGAFSKKIIEEAYNAYLRDGNPNMEFDRWRGTISGYALAKDKQGDYIYDETIAESLHDVYLNGNNAKPASKYVVNTLKKHVEG